MIDTTEAQLYKIGSGSAQVWGQNRALNVLQQQYDQDRLRKQKEEAQLGDDLAKINLDAAREADLPELMKKYNGVKDTFFKLRQTKDNMERMKLQSQLMNQKQELLTGTGLSKQAQAQEAEFGKLPLNHADDINDDFVPNYSKLRKTSIFSPDYKTQAEYLSQNALLPKFDVQAYQKGLGQRSLQTTEGKPVTTKLGRTTKQFIPEVTELSYDNVLDNLISDYKNDRKFKRYVNANFKDVPPQEAVQQLAKDFYEGNKDALRKVKETKPISSTELAPDRFYEHEAWKLKNKPPKASESLNDVLYRQNWIKRMLKGWNSGERNDSGEEFKSILKGVGGYDEKDINSMIKKVNYDPNIIVFDIPKRTINKGQDNEKVIEGRQIKVNTKDPNSDAQLNQMLNDAVGEKVSLSKFRTSNPSGKITDGVKKQTPTQSTKTVPLSKVKGLVGKKGYEGYTEKELIDYYKSQGYTIK